VLLLADEEKGGKLKQFFKSGLYLNI
jgi:hypothetical protein